MVATPGVWMVTGKERGGCLRVITRKPSGRGAGGATLGLVTVRHAPASAGEVRRRLGADLARSGVSSDVVDDATLLASELVGNAVRYAHPLPGGGAPGDLVGRHDCVRLRVTDGGGLGAPRVRDAGPSDVRGRGLAIVDSLARH